MFQKVVRNELSTVKLSYDSWAVSNDIIIMAMVKTKNQLILYVNDNTVVREITISYHNETNRANLMEEVLLRPNSIVEALDVTVRVVDLRFYSMAIVRYVHTGELVVLGTPLTKSEFNGWISRTITQWYASTSDANYTKWIDYIEQLNVA